MQLYTVVLENKHMISTFDEKGRKTGERMEFIKQTICDLPHSTALMYQSKDAGRVTVIKQDMSSSNRDNRRDISTRKVRSTPSAVTTTKKAPAARPTQSAVQHAAATGNLTAAINAKGE